MVKQNKNNERLEAVLILAREVNQENGNPHKSKICQTNVNYVGELKSNPDRIQAISHVSNPTDKAAVQRFWGMIGYVSKSIPNMTKITKS